MLILIGMMQEELSEIFDEAPIASPRMSAHRSTPIERVEVTAFCRLIRRPPTYLSNPPIFAAPRRPQ
jgi:hypothetical protein